MTGTAWVVGSSGLLGRAIARALVASGTTEVLAIPMDWSDAAAFDQATKSALKLISKPGHGPWQIYWCAGAGIVGTSEDALASELEQFGRFLRIVEAHVKSTGSAGSIFYASSAGGVYAHSQHPPFTEITLPVPNSPYGRAKLAAEDLVRTFSSRTGVPALIGRISNLYGPDQRLEKAQGIISQLCKSLIGGTPTSIYVSLDTIRDYISADDCAALAIDSMARLRTVAGANETHFTKILASQQAVTLGAILGMCRSIFKRRPNARIGSSPNARFQVRDLRLISVVWPDLDDRAFTPLAAGIHAVATSMLLTRGAQSASSRAVR